MIPMTEEERAARLEQLEKGTRAFKHEVQEYVTRVDAIHQWHTAVLAAAMRVITTALPGPTLRRFVL